MNVMLKDENAIYYECGYSCDNAVYLRLGKEAFFITDSRYTLDAREHVRNAEVIIDRDLYGRAAALIEQAGIRNILFDPKEWSVAGFERIKGVCKKVTFVATPDYSHKKRIVKRDDEIEKLATAVKLGKKAFKRFAEAVWKEGIGKDEYYLHYLAQSVMSDFGHYALSFDPIVAINANAAKPHAHPTDTRLCEGDLLLFDAGLKFERYCSDRTRTALVKEGFRFKKTQHFGKKKIQKAYDAVLKAHDRAIAKARTGMKAKKIDALAREVIEKAGFGEYFVHSTGHGVGLDIHEMPYISAKSKTRIEDGMVFTIEPGIYIPGAFGIRIEDMVVMREGRAEVL